AHQPPGRREAEERHGDAGPEVEIAETDRRAADRARQIAGRALGKLPRRLRDEVEPGEPSGDRRERVGRELDLDVDTAAFAAGTEPGSHACEAENTDADGRKHLASCTIYG